MSYDIANSSDLSVVRAALGVTQDVANINARLDAVGSKTFVLPLWSELSLKVGTSGGVGASVLDTDTGTHTDPVVGGTVPNAGTYTWSVSPAGWRHIGSNYMAAASDAEAIAGVLTDRSVTPHAGKAAIDAKVDPLIVVNTVPTRDVAAYDPLVTYSVSDNTVIPISVNKRTGAIAVGALEDQRSDRLLKLGTYARDVFPWRWWVELASGAYALAVDVFGRVWNRGWGDAEYNPTPTRDWSPVVWGIGKGGKLLAFIGQDGAWNFHKRSPKMLLDGRVITNTSDLGDYVRGTLVDGGCSIDVRWRKGATTGAAIIEDPRPMIYVLSFGQSNAGRGGAYTDNPRKVTDALYASTCLTMGASGVPVVFWAGNVAENASALDDFVPLRDLASLQYPQELVTMVGFGLEAAYRSHGGPSPGIVVHADVAGGEPISSFVKGTLVYNNTLAHARRVVELAALNGRRITPIILYTQGESGEFGSIFGTTLSQIYTDLSTDFTTIFGVKPKMVIQQVARSEAAATPTDVNLEILSVCRARPSEIFLAGPIYDARCPDMVHGDAESRAIQGERVGEVMYRVLEGVGWTPFASSSISRSGAVCTIDYNVPPGCDITLDPGPGTAGDGWLPPLAHHGFYYSDASSGASVASVNVVKVNGRYTRVVVTLTTDPGAATGKTLVYANTIEDPTVDGWTACRGSLRVKLRGSELKSRTPLVMPDGVYVRAAVEQWSL